MNTDRIRLHSVLLPIPICFALYGNYRQGLNNLFSWFLFGWPRCFFVVWAQSCCMLAHLLTMFLVQIHNISALLLIYNKNGLINTTLNNHFETKFKGRDTTQSTPQKKKKNRYLVYWYSSTCSFKMTGQGSWNKPTSSKSSEKSHFRPHDFMYIPNWQLKEVLRKFEWRLKPLFRILMV